MDPVIIDALIRLIEEAQSGATSEGVRDAARATGGLPVVVDMGGVLVLMRDGDVVHYDPESRKTVRVDDRWRTAALVKAGKKYPELRSLCPARPSQARDCYQCQGTGVLLGSVECGTCMGTGWLS